MCLILPIFKYIYGLNHIYLKNDLPEIRVWQKHNQLWVTHVQVVNKLCNCFLKSEVKCLASFYTAAEYIGKILCSLFKCLVSIYEYRYCSAVWKQQLFCFIIRRITQVVIFISLLLSSLSRVLHWTVPS